MKATTTLYRKLALPAIVVPFIERIQPVLRQTDVAICRSGGTTLAELAAAGVPAHTVAVSARRRRSSRKNADHFAAAGAATVLDAREITGRLDNAIARALIPLIADADGRDRMGQTAAGLARPDAAWHVATMIQQLVLAAAETPAGLSA